MEKITLKVLKELIIEKCFKKFKTFNFNLVLFYSHLPAETSMGFQSAESNYLFKKINNCVNLTFNGKQMDIRNQYCYIPRKSNLQFISDKIAYETIFPKAKKHFVQVDLNQKVSANLAYGIFLNNTYMYLPFFEKNKIPFVFTLYPGGGFGIDNELSDSMLREIFSSKMFKKVIVTMPTTRDYLINKGFCKESEIVYIYGGIVQNSEYKQKLQYKKDKDTFDICFCAHRYTQNGEDKGYDTAIEVAKKILPINPNIHFHIVGPWENVINLSDINQNQIHFYGIQPKEFFVNFYSKMDIFLSPNRYSKIFPGNFDGFPLGIEAALAGVYLMVADPLGMKNNTPLSNSYGFEVITNDSDKITVAILSKLNNLDKFYEESILQQKSAISVFDIEEQMKLRLSVLKNYINI